MAVVLFCAKTLAAAGAVAVAIVRRATDRTRLLQADTTVVVGTERIVRFRLLLPHRDAIVITTGTDRHVLARARTLLARRPTMADHRIDRVLLLAGLAAAALIAGAVALSAALPVAAEALRAVAARAVAPCVMRLSLLRRRLLQQPMVLTWQLKIVAKGRLLLMEAIHWADGSNTSISMIGPGYFCPKA